MEVVVCLDDRGGMCFNHRRQSRDREVVKNVLALAENRPLWMDDVSALLFAGAENVHVAEDFLAMAPQGALCFVEDRALTPYAGRIERLYVYRWNRLYPADRYFDLRLEEWRLIETTEFPGYSHERITREAYER